MERPTLRKIIRRAFPDIPEAESENLISIGEIHSYPPTSVLCKEGNIESTFYIILEGEVQVSKVINELETRKLKILKTGDFFGELALIHDAPRTATVVTTAPTTVLEIHKEAFEHLLEQSSGVSLAMVREVSGRLRENDEMAIEDLRIKAGELAAAYRKLAELDFARREFLTTIAHELRTPLTAANGFLQMIKTGNMEGEGLKTALDTVSRNVQKIVTLVNDILFLQEMDLIFQDVRSIDVGQVVNNAIERLGESVEKKQIDLDFSVDSEVKSLMGDEKSLERAFSEIIKNAIKYSPDGGKVGVRVFQEDSAVVVRVKDQGVGIPEDAQPRVFDRFFHLDQVGGHLFGGVGLGLSIAQKVIEEHGGEITVESKLEKGSLFTVKVRGKSVNGDSDTVNKTPA